MEVQSIAEFAKAKGFTQVAPQVRVNTNGYHFITFINAANEAENIYFSKDASSKVTAGQAVDADMMKQHQLATVTNEAGEVRFKLIGNSERIDLMSLFAA